MKKFAVFSGFLGSGKTTTMMALTRYYSAQYAKAAMISNDLGHGVSLADNRFAQLSGCKASEITDDCICYVNEQLADRLARKVVKTRHSVRLEPMNPYERKVIHSTLQSNPDVTTRSEGQDPYRRVIIELK